MFICEYIRMKDLIAEGIWGHFELLLATQSVRTQFFLLWLYLWLWFRLCCGQKKQRLYLLEGILPCSACMPSPAWAVRCLSKFFAVPCLSCPVLRMRTIVICTSIPKHPKTSGCANNVYQAPKVICTSIQASLSHPSHFQLKIAPTPSLETQFRFEGKQFTYSTSTITFV